MSLLGLAEAGLGENAQAIGDGQRAAALMPVSKDAMDGPSFLAAQAEIEARVGDGAAALRLLRQLLAIPAGRVMSEALLQRDPRFRSLSAQVQSPDAKP